jgi:hypothetical protein
MTEFRNKLVLTNRGPELRNRVIGIAGRKGSGKSALTREILKHCMREFVFDTMGEHTWVPEKFNSLDEAWVYIAMHGGDPQPFQGAYVAEDAGDESLDTDFAEICTAVWESGNMTLAVEELPMLSEPNYVPPAFNRLVRLGRHRSVNILYTGQRLSECPRRVTAATDIFALFHTSEPGDLDRIAERCGPETAEVVSHLGDHEFVIYDVATRGLVLIDSKWYDFVLNVNEQWTPAIGGMHGRPALWSLDDAR